MGGHIRNYGVYRLPDGTELVAKRQISGELVLYTQENYDNDGEAEYKLDDKGFNLLKNEKPTDWNLRDIKYTGRDAW